MHYVLSLKKQYITNREPNGISKPEASAIKVERELNCPASLGHFRGLNPSGKDFKSA